MEPQIRYARTSDGVSIAWFAIGAGAPYVWPAGAGPGVLENWRLPEFRRLLEGIAERSTLIVYDMRGFGLSDRGTFVYSCDDLVRDMEAVVDAAAPRHFVLQTFGSLSMPAITYASRHPERVRAMVLLNGILRGSDQSSGAKELARLAAEDWDAAAALFARANEASYGSVLTLEQNEEMFRRETPREAFLALNQAIPSWDASDAAARVETPAIVVYYTQSLITPMESCRKLAAALPNATFVSAGREDEAGTRLDHVRSAVADFLRGARATSPDARSAAALPSGTAVILFIDIVDSAALTETMGDAAFRESSRALDRAVRTVIRAHNGTPVEGKVLGDGVMAVFASAAQAIAAARACVAASEHAGLAFHVGLHAGDVIRESDNVFGGAVNIASRICALSGPGEVFLSATVRDLARTSAGVSFEDRGEHHLKGIEDPVRVFAVRAAE